MAKGKTEKMWRKALIVTAVLVFVGFGAAAVSLFRWQILRGEEMSTAALDQSLRSTTLSAMRGTIYDATARCWPRAPVCGRWSWNPLTFPNMTIQRRSGAQ